jgi:hypothetical protein
MVTDSPDSGGGGFAGGRRDLRQRYRRLISAYAAGTARCDNYSEERGT